MHRGGMEGHIVFLRILLGDTPTHHHGHLVQALKFLFGTSILDVAGEPGSRLRGHPRDLPQFVKEAIFILLIRTARGVEKPVTEVMIRVERMATTSLEVRVIFRNMMPPG